MLTNHSKIFLLFSIHILLLLFCLLLLFRLPKSVTLVSKG